MRLTCGWSKNEFDERDVCYMITTQWISNFVLEIKITKEKIEDKNNAYFKSKEDALKWNWDWFAKKEPYYICKYSGEAFNYDEKCFAIWGKYYDINPKEDLIREKMNPEIAYFHDKKKAILWNKRFKK